MILCPGAPEQAAGVYGRFCIVLTGNRVEIAICSSYN